MKFPCSQRGSRRGSGQARSQRTLGTAREGLEGDLGGEASGTPEELTAHLAPMAPGLLWWLSAGAW